MDVIEIIPLDKPIQGTVSIGGSKSYTNRALIMASLAQGKSTLSSLSMSDDSTVLINALQQLGIQIYFIDKTTVEVVGALGKLGTKSLSINVGRAGTALRFLCALSCLVPGQITLDGTTRMRERPIKDLIEALRELGADVHYGGVEGHAPVKITGKLNLKSSISIRGNISSQFITALLLIAPALKQGLRVNVFGEQISKSYIDMTIDGQKSFGVSVINNAYQSYDIAPKSFYKATEYCVEGDASGASYLFGLAAVTGGVVTVKNINPRSSQGDIHFVDILEQMGCEVKKDESSITVVGPAELKSVTVNMSLMPDTAQTLAVISAFAKGKTHITGLSTLKVKETDRIEALFTELSKVGITSITTHDSITIIGGKPHEACIHTYKDHRMALAFSIMGAKVKGIQIEDRGVVSKSFPDYWEKLKSLGVLTKNI